MTPTDRPRERAAFILSSCETGLFADDLIAQSRAGFEQRDNAFILELVYGTLRNRAKIDWALNQFSKKTIDKADPWTRNILRLGAYQLLFLDRVPASAAINTAVNLAKRYGRSHGYVNALLRNLDRNRDSVLWPDEPVKR
ncbi:MAG TPA: transcription antitermination factor NusB, partial [Nitrospirota bacterium]